MKHNSYIIIVNYIIKELNIKKKINYDTSLSELGLDGDDLHEFLLKFFKEFKIQYSKDNFKKVLPSESGFFMATLMSLIGVKQEKNINKEILLKDLVQSYEKKRWIKTLKN